jgi:Kef-type K+ transport system membrane component KefB
MDQVWFVAALWLLMALVAVLIANWLKISTALSEIVIGTVAQFAIGALAGSEALGAKAPWITFLAGTGAIVLTFLAGAELDPNVFRSKWKESTAVGLVGFFGPFLGAAIVAHYLLGWAWRPSWLAGVALSTTSVAVVYAVMLELGFNQTTYGKAILAACFINDLGTVLALGLIFSPFTTRTLVFLGVSLVLFLILPSSRDGSSSDTGDVSLNLRPSTCCFCSSDSAAWRCGRAVRRYCRRTSSAWFWRAAWAKIIF